VSRDPRDAQLARGAADLGKFLKELDNVAS